MFAALALCASYVLFLTFDVWPFGTCLTGYHGFDDYWMPNSCRSLFGISLLELEYVTNTENENISAAHVSGTCVQPRTIGIMPGSHNVNVRHYNCTLVVIAI